MSAEIIVTLVMGVAIAVVIVAQFHGLRFGIVELHGDIGKLSKGMDRMESARERLREAIADCDLELFDLPPKQEKS